MSKIESCEDALRLLAAHLDGELDDATDDELERHLAICQTCYSRAEFERRLKARLVEIGREPVPQRLTDRVRALIREFAVTGAD